MTRTIALMGLSSLLMSCATDIEGDEAFECSDGADNDGNGYFDCQDNGCWNSPDCAGGNKQQQQQQQRRSHRGRTSSHRCHRDVHAGVALRGLLRAGLLHRGVRVPRMRLQVDVRRQRHAGRRGRKPRDDGRRVHAGEAPTATTPSPRPRRSGTPRPGEVAPHVLLRAGHVADPRLGDARAAHALRARAEQPASYSQFYITSMLESWDDSSKEVVHVFEETVDLGGLPTNLVHTLTLRFNTGATN